MKTYVTTQNNIGDLISKMVFSRIMTIKSKQK